MTYQVYDGDKGVVRDATPEEAAEIAARAAALVAPEEISPRQFRQSLNHFSFRQQVDGAIAAAADQDLKDWYEFTSAFQRHHPKVLAMAAALGFTDAQLDQVWTYGASI